MQALPKEVLLWLIVITLIKSFLLLPSHNCIIIKNNVQFSRYIVVASFISFASGQGQKLSHSAAPPLKIKPTSLGFDFVRRRGREFCSELNEVLFPKHFIQS